MYDTSAIAKLVAEPRYTVVTRKGYGDANTAYEHILREVEQLTPIERLRLSIELRRRTDLPTGADIVAALRGGEQLDPETVDEMERIIDEGCEQVDPRGW